jgi:hypothetical protein
MNWASILLIPLFAGMIVFELLLVYGMPWGKAAWGGQHKVLSNKLRIASAASSLIYIFAIVIVLTKAGVIATFSQEFVSIVLWIMVVFFGLGIFMNLLSRSRLERNIFTPVAAAACLLCLTLATN